MSSIYVIGSLRNPKIPQVANILREAGHDVFDDWFSPGHECDDMWRKYETLRGRSYLEALNGHHAEHQFAFDLKHIRAAEVGVLVLPAGKSAHMELGYMIGRGQRGYMLLDQDDAKLPEDWLWLTGIYEGEGTLTKNGPYGMQLSVTMKDADVICRLHKISGVGRIQGPYAHKGNKPNWNVMWRWSVYKKEDILFVLKGMWETLGERRKEQAQKVLASLDMSYNDIDISDGPQHFRFDLMYKFAHGIALDTDQLLGMVR